MTKVYRVRAHTEADVSANVERVWELLMDWAGILRWWDNSVPGDAMHLSRVYLEGEYDAIPRTRVIVRDNAVAAGLPLENRETLFFADKLAKRIYYNGDNDLVEGVRNYIQTTCLDVLDDKHCRMLCTSIFDVMEPHDPEAVRKRIEAAHGGIVGGFINYFIKETREITA